MAEAQKLELKFEVKSLNKSRKTIEYINDAQALSGELEKALAEQLPGAKVTIRREEGIPIAPIIQHLIVNIDWHAVVSGIEKGVATFATAQVLTVLKEKLQNLSAKPIPAASVAASKGPAKKAAKTASKKTPAKKAKGKAKP
jgi:hypothetical protein